MKSTLLLATFLVGLCICVQAQNYSFTKATEPYTNLVGATPISGTTSWDDETWTVPIGFTFNFYDQTYTQIEVSDGYTYFFTPQQLQYLAPFSDDLRSIDVAGVSTSPISYQLAGTPGSHILKIEWQKAGFFDQPDTDFMNFQLWLYELDGKIEVRFGASNITTTQIQALAGLVSQFDTVNFTMSGHFLSGPVADPQMVVLNNEFILNVPFLSGVPANGTVWRFMPVTTSAPGPLTGSPISVYPNPFTDQVRLSGISGPGSIKIFDGLGRQIEHLIISGNEDKIDLSYLAPGPYFIQVVQDGMLHSQSVVKQ